MKKISSPILTIAIPTYNRPKLLYSSLNSAINQSYEGSYEILVLDNSTDLKIKKKIDDLINLFQKKKNIKFIRNHYNLGMFGNWNKCLNKASGEYLSILNDDDLLNYDFVENVIKDLDGSKMLIYDYEIISDDKVKQKIGGKFRKIINKLNLTKRRKISTTDMIFRNPSNGSLGVVFKKNNAISIGGYDIKNAPCSDYYFNYKYINKFGGLNIKKNICKYRIAVNTSLNKNCLKDFVIKDFYLREKIYIRFFSNNKFIISISENLNFLQSCSQCARYIFLRNLTIYDFKDLYLGKSNYIKNKLINLISCSKIFCIFVEVIIFLTWKSLFFIVRIINSLKF